MVAGWPHVKKILHQQKLLLSVCHWNILFFWQLLLLRRTFHNSGPVMNPGEEINQLHINHIHTQTMTRLLIWFVTPLSCPLLAAMKTATCTVSTAVNAPWEPIKLFCLPNGDTFHWAGQHEPLVWESSSAINTEGVHKHVFTHQLLNQHHEIKTEFVKRYGLQLQNRQFDGQMKPKQHWSRNTSLQRQRA